MGTIQSKRWAQRPCLPSPGEGDRMFAQTQSMTAVLAQVATGLLGSGPRGTRPWQGGLGPAGDCRWRHRTAGPAEGGAGHKCFCDSEMGRGRERDPTARPPLPCTLLTRDTAVLPMKVRGHETRSDQSHADIGPVSCAGEKHALHCSKHGPHSKCHRRHMWRGMRAVESAGQHPLVTKSLGAHTWGSGPRGPVCSPVRHQWDTSRT